MRKNKIKGEGYKYRMRKIASLTNKRNNLILDIGFFEGHNKFLKGLIIGLDIVLPKEKPENYIGMVKGDIMKETVFPNNFFNTIVMSGVLEHLENPTKALKECNRILKKNGRLILEVPNPYFLPVIISDMLMNLRYYFFDTHINMFPRRILLKLLWNNGFQLEDIKSCGFNLSNQKTIPMIQQFAQDIIVITRKNKLRGEKESKLIKLRKEKYDKENNK